MTNKFITSKYARQLCARELLSIRKDINRMRAKNNAACVDLYRSWLPGVRFTCQTLGYDIENVLAGRKVTK